MLSISDIKDIVAKLKDNCENETYSSEKKKEAISSRKLEKET
jgi:hypothetical protein